MTTFAFIADLIPLVRATGPGAIGNRTIGTTAVGVLVIPGLYYLFAKIGDGLKLIKDEDDEPLSELFEREDRTDSIEHHGSAPADDNQPNHNPPGEHKPGDSAGQAPETGAES